MLSIGKVSKDLGCSVETLRYYEKIALIEPAHRSDGGHRFYNARQIQQLKFIMSAKELGFTLEQISDLLKLGASSKDCTPVLSLVDKNLCIVNVKINQLQRLQSTLEKLSSECRSCCAVDPAATACNILEAFNSK
jgi:DNA-binding transcriptional MerR regulator